MKKYYVIVDIDGTVANCQHRVKHIEGDKKDWDKFYEEAVNDEPYENVVELVNLLSAKYSIVFCTGRPNEYRDDTLAWLKKHFKLGFFDCLLMREDGDYRPDYEIKPELLDYDGIELDEILLVLEDRDSVVKAWRDLGLTCLQPRLGKF